MPGTVELLHVASDLWMSPLCPIRAGGGWYWYAVFSLRNTESHFPPVISFRDTSRSHNVSVSAWWKLKKSGEKGTLEIILLYSDQPGGNIPFARPTSHEKSLKEWASGFGGSWLKACPGRMENFMTQIRPGRMGRKGPRKKRTPNPRCTSVTPGWIFSRTRPSVGTFKNCISEQALYYRTS